jgi:hypothetical protein
MPAASRGTACCEEVVRVLKKLAFAAVIAGAITAYRRRSAGKAEADLWHEATSGPGAVSTPTAH